jgi:hypothetical protein
VKIVLAYGLVAMIIVEAAAFVFGRGWLPVLSGAITALVLLGVRRSVGPDVDPAAGGDDDGMPESLRRWLARTERLISHADSAQGDWDRHLRPLLARQFELASGQQQRKDPEAYRATGEMVFGPQLWAWVEPDGAARTGTDRPAPGRAVLDDILRRIERI